MVFSFFRGGDEGLEHVQHEIVSMVGRCQHSFDLAMSCLVTDGDIEPIGEEVRATDWAINGIEESVRRELVVHSAVHGGADVGAVLASLLMVKKLERVGDQAKNIFDLAAEGVRFSEADDYDRFLDFRSRVSQLFTDTADALAEPDAADLAGLDRRAEELMGTFDDLVNALIHDDGPARYAVPRAMLFRYLKRICANLISVATTAATGIDRTGDVDLDE
ncbi:PhoU domain-containing protein [Acidimicrobiia bacterium EGI L10123]|uniref:PhoU domain-containing protein n=1 Tax=Salinilacustrithrix flava TaxID=2957203 RepID=UPI003D7C14C2|nr:PhoU domain-containing protein [Acidimicrobiia bacterium EGI L10123]